MPLGGAGGTGNVSIDMDISDVVAETARLLNLNAQQTKSWNDTAKSVSAYKEVTDDAGNTSTKLITTVTGMIDRYKQLSATIGEGTRTTATATSSYDLLNQKLTQLNKTQIDAANASKVATQVLKEQQAAAKAAAAEQAKIAKEAAAAAKAAAAEQAKIAKEAAAAAKEMSSFDVLAKRISGTLANLALYRGFNAISHQLTDAVSNAASFQEQVARIQAASQGAGVSAQEWTQSIRNVSNALGVDFKDAAEAAHTAITSQLVSGGGVEAYVKTVGNLSKVTGATMKESGDALSTFMTTFGHTAEDAEASAAKLARTASLGKAQIGDLGKSFQQASEQAKILGVSENELLAAFALLSRDLGAGKAAQSLNVMFGHLIEPSGEIKKALGGQNLANGMNDLQSVLKIVEKLKGQGFSEFNIGGGARGIKALHELTNAGQEYTKTLNQISNSQAQFDNAKAIVSDTDAAKLKRLGETLKNTLADTLGSSILKVASAFSDMAGKGEDATHAMESGVRSVVEWVEKLGIAVGVTTLAFKTLGATAGVGVGAGFAGFLGGQAILSQFYDTHNRGKDNAGLGVEQTVKDLIASQSKSAEQNNEIDKVKQGWTDAAAVVNNQYQKALEDVNRRIQSLSDSSKQFRDSLSSVFSGALNKGKEELADIQHKIEEIIGVQRNASKSNASFTEHGYKVKEAAFQEFADPLQHTNIQQQEINRTQAEIMRLSKDGSGEAAKKIDELSKHLQDTFAQAWSYYEKQQEKAFKEQQTANAKAGLPYQTEYLADANSLSEGLLRIDQLREQAIKAQNAAAQEQLKILEAQKKAKEEQLASQQKLIHEYVNFSAVNDKGELKAEYKTPAGKLNQQKLMADLDSLEKRVGSELKPQNIQDSLALEKLMAEQKQRVKADAGLQGTKQGILNAQGANSQQLKDQNQALEDSRKKASEGNQAARDAANALTTIGKGVANAESEQGRHTIGGNIFGSQGKADLERQLQANAEQIDQVVKNIKSLATNPELMRTGPGGQKFVDVQAIQQQKEVLDQLLQRYKPQDSGAQIPGLGSWNDIQKGLSALDENLKGAAKTQEESKNTLLGSVADLQRFQMGLGEFSTTASQTSQTLLSLDTSARSAASALAAIQNLTSQAPSTVPPGGEADSGPIPNSNGWKPQFYGGPLHREYGGPIGQDNIPMFGSQGEMVMNAAATSRYYTQLMGANTGSRIPQRFETGGVVNQTNNINISGEKSPEATAYQIVMALKRAKRLGTI